MNKRSYHEVAFFYKKKIVTDKILSYNIISNNCLKGLKDETT